MLYSLIVCTFYYILCWCLWFRYIHPLIRTLHLTLWILKPTRRVEPGTVKAEKIIRFLMLLMILKLKLTTSEVKIVVFHQNRCIEHMLIKKICPDTVYTNQSLLKKNNLNIPYVTLQQRSHKWLGFSQQSCDKNLGSFRKSTKTTSNVSSKICIECGATSFFLVLVTPVGTWKMLCLLTLSFFFSSCCKVNYLWN